MSEQGEEPGLEVLTKWLLDVAENGPERPARKAMKEAARQLGLEFKLEK